VINRTNTRRIAIALALGGALLVGYPAVSGGPLWDLGAACGYVCLILFVCLYVFPVRGDGLPHARLLGLSQHKTIGWCVLAAAAAHIAAVLLAEPLTTRYLLPSAPLFMWCGVVALLCVIASVITGLSARSHMRRAPVSPQAALPSPPTAASPKASASSPRGAALSPQAATSLPNAATATTRGVPPKAGAMHSRATLHVALAAVLMLTACGHVIGSSQLLSGTVKTVVALLLMCLPLGWYVLRPRPTRQRAPGGAAHSMASPARVAVRRASHVAAVGLVALLPATTAKQILLEPVARPAAIAVNFPHDLHTSVSCVTCHHNYVDHTGTTACIECHRSAHITAEAQPPQSVVNQATLFGGGKEPGLRAASAAPIKSAEQTFHTFCRDCHTQLALDSHKHGPTRSCAACHQGIRSNNL
jgi:hypothetical protein